MKGANANGIIMYGDKSRTLVGCFSSTPSIQPWIPNATIASTPKVITISGMPRFRVVKGVRPDKGHTQEQMVLEPDCTEAQDPSIEAQEPSVPSI